MRTLIICAAVLAATAYLPSCSNEKNEKKEDAKTETKSSDADTPASLAAQWCELNSHITKATTDEEKAKAKQTLKEFEASMESKHADKMKEIEAEVEKCEAASEGR